MRDLAPALAAALLMGFAASHAVAQSQAPDASADRHDVLFIAVDDLNDWVGYLGGHPQTKTPNIDRLAARGMAFMNAHSPSAMCNPSRTALLTGLRPATTGLYTNFPDWRNVPVFRGVATLPRYFRDNGYTTLGAGKIFHAHTFGSGQLDGFNDTTAWDEFYPELDWQLPHEIAPSRKPANGNPIYTGFDWAPLVAEDFALGDGQVAAWLQRQLLAATDGPRFVAAGIYRPHLPWYVPQKYFDLHPLAEIVLPDIIPNDLDDVPLIADNNYAEAKDIHLWTLTTESWKPAVQGYLASISYADAIVGQLIDALDASGRADRTIVVLWSDHGFHLGEKGRWRKSTLWNESTHVPFIVVAPGVTTPGSRTAEPVSLMDIYPTLAELAGIESPAHVEGRSLVALLEDPDREWDYPALVTWDYGNHAVITDHHRYIRHNDGSEELYDIVDDPNEWTNLADRPEYDDLKIELAAHMPKTSAPRLEREVPR